jgi:hypothetical protein
MIFKMFLKNLNKKWKFFAWTRFTVIFDPSEQRI